MKKVTLAQLEQSEKAASYPELARRIKEKAGAGILKPIVKSGMNGKSPALYNRYWLREEAEDYSAYLEEINYKLSPAIDPGYYRTHPDKYKEDRKWVLLLSEYLTENKEALKAPSSINERSFEIFRREKFLKLEGGRTILTRTKISGEALNVYQTTEPLSYYSHSKKTPQNILIIENKDTFYTMRRHLLEGGSSLLGLLAGTLIYGGGKAILGKMEEFSVCAEPYLKEKDNRIYYFGDLDYEGIHIYEDLYHLFMPEKKIRPFVPAYHQMLKKAPNRDELPDAKDGQNRNIGRIFLDFFEKEKQKEILSLLESGRYIPQEILNGRDLTAFGERANI